MALILFILRLNGSIPLAGQGLTASLVLFIGGAQLMMIGVLGQYIGRIYDEVRGLKNHMMVFVPCMAVCSTVRSWQ